MCYFLFQTIYREHEVILSSTQGNADKLSAVLNSVVSLSQLEKTLTESIPTKHQFSEFISIIKKALEEIKEDTETMKIGQIAGDKLAQEFLESIWNEEQVMLRKVNESSVEFFMYDSSKDYFGYGAGGEDMLAWIRTISTTESYVKDIFARSLEGQDVFNFNNRQMVPFKKNPKGLVKKGVLGICNRKDSIVLDVGANTAYYGLFAAAYGCIVDAFEPQPQCNSWIKSAILLNNFQTTFTLYENLVSNVSTVISARLRSGCWGSWKEDDKENQYAPPKWNSKETRQVSSVRLDDLYYHRKGLIISMMKMDVEGNEISALLSAEKLLRAKRIEHFVVELTPSFWNRVGFSFKEGTAFFRTLIHNWGYDGVCAATGPGLLTDALLETVIVGHMSGGQTDCHFWIRKD